VDDPTSVSTGREDRDTFGTGDLRWTGPDPDVGGGGITDVGGWGGPVVDDSANGPPSLEDDTDSNNGSQGVSYDIPAPSATRTAARQLGDFLSAPPGTSEERLGRTRAQTRALI
ncbi:unnamed protein product, partial [Discosporangium mesarthrocarpum]